ncbi:MULTISPECIES: beta-ketoacyl synthase N-terminal-like domain-containing protein [Streptomyces]|uniref:beta-ketoacyl synthase N-terminal-like domain-containing protein n=1 Tax=Streptomyces TaxID=1883 RepID=UPI00067BBEEB|nr:MULTISPECIES: beta-ketoacyl synthase N-terminal-like domain-containing protein [Streptomyces]MDX2917328.1 beta-ketoacyl synthase N-terminal-like domain-containing protein [Streptomyces sp. NE06-03C]MDX3605487.1 beta-ketoacyl synthase N-terminal-like domain-containing protein [Streptomyces sp. FL06-04B]MDX3736423.1 beta-ketoacyl synthase N-terminal-like domain-containing protein [Streptomyces sp. ID01-15D]
MSTAGARAARAASVGVAETGADADRAPVVTGLGVLSPGGVGVEALWRVCRTGEGEFREVTHFDVSRTGTRIAGFVPAEPGAPVPGEAARLPYLLHRAVTAALADARERTGVREVPTALVLASTDSGGCPGTEVWRAWSEGGRSHPNAGWEPYGAPVVDGPVVQVGNASAAGATASGVAADLLRDGVVERVVVCGVDTVTETAFHGLASLRTLSPRGCRPFSTRRAGIRISECGAAMVLERATAATNGAGYARLRGWGSSNEASQAARPDYEGVTKAVRRALADARTEPGLLDYVNAHAAGTRHGDIAELRALDEVLGDRLPKVPVVSTKAALGHCQGAAGTVEAIMTVLTLARGDVLPTLGLEDRDPRWDHLNLGDRAPEAPPSVGMTISCGLGGSNVAVVFSRD